MYKRKKHQHIKGEGESDNPMQMKQSKPIGRTGDSVNILTPHTRRKRCNR